MPLSGAIETAMKSDILLLLPDSIISYLSTFLSIGDWSSLGNLNATIAFDRNTLWVSLYRWKFLQQDDDKSNTNKRSRSTRNVTRTSRTTRSGSNPRLALFNALRNRIFTFDHRANMMVSCLRKFDSPRSLEELYLPDFPINRIFVPCADSTILCVAVRLNRWRCVRYLVMKLGADMNVQDNNGMNPLLIAAWCGNIKGVRILFQLSTSLQREYVHPTSPLKVISSISIPNLPSSSPNSSSSPSSSSSSSSKHNSSSSIQKSSSSTIVNEGGEEEDTTGITTSYPDNHSPLKTKTNMKNILNPTEYKKYTDIKKSFIINMDLVGSPSMTSVCGGKGPYTALVWAKRKSVVCPERPEFNEIVLFLEKQASSSFAIIDDNY